MIRYAIDHLQRPSDSDQRVAFLLLDVGVETIFKTFLQLPEEVTGTSLSYTERGKAAEGNFHELTRGIKKASGSRLAGIDLSHVQFYHDLRNKLYHQGNGITIPSEKAKGYAAIAVQILQRLLDIDLQIELSRPEQELKRKEEEAAIVERVRIAQANLRQQIQGLEQDLSLALETIEPTLVLPSFRLQVERWQDHWSQRLTVQLLSLSRTSYLETRWSPDLLIEIYNSLPPVLRHFVDKYEVEVSIIATRAVFNNDFVETLLFLANITLGLPLDQFNYGRIVVFLGVNPVYLPPHLDELADPLGYLINEGEELIQEVVNFRQIVSQLK